jgi:dipeptidyl aminopeptidase/acylaminoacyl peptidase
VAAFFPLTTFVEPDVLAGSNFERPSRFVPILGGPLADNRELARKLSPVERVSAGGPPLFLAHGDADVVLSVRHSRRLAEAARKVGQPVELLEVKGGGHGFSGADVSPTPAEVARRTADFLLKHLQPQPKGSP